MKPMPWRRSASVAVALGCALAFLRCGQEPLAGSSVTTGNPTEIQVSFTGENGPVALTGRVEVYGATQVPIPGFRPEPLARFDVSGQQEFRLASEDVAAIADSLWPVGSLEGDSLARFHLVIAGEGQGAIVRDLSLRRKDGEFEVDAVAKLVRNIATVRLEVDLQALTAYAAYMKLPLAANARLNYLFLKGTGFMAQETGGEFRFPALPQGNHQVSFLSVPDPAKGNLGIEDSADVYHLDRPLSTDALDTLSVTELDFQLSMPQRFKN